VNRFSLPVVEQRSSQLEKCVYCPKLCRAACPISNAEPNETLTPWGKMSSVYFAGRGLAPLDAETASLAWACTGCMACKERCDHKNPVADVLAEARGPLTELGLQPSESASVIARGESRRARLKQAVAELSNELGPEVVGDGPPLLLGCGYTLKHPEVAGLAARVAAKLLGGPVSLLDGCCGYPERMAGDALGAERLAGEIGAACSGRAPLVLDVGCAQSLRANGDVRLVLDLAHDNLERFKAITPEPSELPRYHDPCLLGRGMGRYEEPRRLLSKVLGQAPLEFHRNRAAADCSGAGALVPIVRPETSKTIAEQRLAQADSAPLVTACASSLTRFRRSGAQVEDLVVFLAKGLGLAL
jgi:Fe-S oxidoreductase